MTAIFIDQVADVNCPFSGVLKAAETFEQETHRFSASLMLNLIYDHFAQSMDDPVVNRIVVSSQRLFGAFVPVRFEGSHARGRGVVSPMLKPSSDLGSLSR